MDDERLHKFISYTIEHGKNPNLELEAQFGKYTKISSTISQITFFKVFEIFKNSPKEYSYINDVLYGSSIKKRTVINDPKSLIKNMFADPVKNDKIEEYAKVYSNMATHSFYLEKDKIFNPIMIKDVIKLKLVNENPNASSDGEKKPITEKHKFRCTFKEGSWNIDMTILLITDCKSKQSGIFFEIEIEFNYKSFISKKQTIDQVKDDFKKYSNIIISLIDCNKHNNVEMEIRHNISNQVNTLERIDLQKLTKSKYAVTDKADGERVFIYIDGKKCIYRLNPTSLMLSKTQIAKNTKISISNTLLDGELITINGKVEFLGFDTLFFNNSDYRNYNLEYRLKLLSVAVKELNKTKINIQFKSKTFYMNDMFANAGKVWNNRQKLFKYNLDGLIFTPIRGSYLGNLPNFKWKDKHSIDIRIMYSKNHDFTTFHVASMYRGKNVYIDHNTNKTFYLNKVVVNDEKYKKLNLVNSHGVAGVSGRLNTGDKFLRNMEDIVEVEYDPAQQKWIYLRLREDKEKPNAYKSVLGVLKAIEDNITIEELSKLKFKPSEYEKIGEKSCYTDYGFNFSSHCITSDICNFYTNVYKQILPKGNTALVLGCDICVLNAVVDVYKNILILEPNCLEIYGKKESEGYIGLIEYMQNNLVNKNSICIVWGNSDISGGLKAFSKSGQLEINAFMKKHKLFDTVFINSFSNIVYDPTKKEFSKQRYESNIRNIKLLAKNVVGIYLSGSQIIKQLEKSSCIITKNKKPHPLYRLYLQSKNLMKYKCPDLFKISKNKIKILEIQRMRNSYISQYQPIIFDKNVQDVFKSSSLKIKECKLIKTFYSSYKKNGGQMSDYDCIIADITKYFVI